MGTQSAGFRGISIASSEAARPEGEWSTCQAFVRGEQHGDAGVDLANGERDQHRCGLVALCGAMYLANTSLRLSRRLVSDLAGVVRVSTAVAGLVFGFEGQKTVLAWTCCMPGCLGDLSKDPLSVSQSGTSTAVTQAQLAQVPAAGSLTTGWKARRG